MYLQRVSQRGAHLALAAQLLIIMATRLPCTTWCCCAAIITAWCMKVGSPSKAGLDITPETPIPDWLGERMDESMAVEGLLQRE
jgi:hypothetical protein